MKIRDVKKKLLEFDGTKSLCINLLLKVGTNTSLSDCHLNKGQINLKIE